MQIQWYPGHMTKARRAMQEDLKLVDLVMELTDARAPLAGRNPDIDKLAAGKARMIFLNKADLADDQATLAWMDYFRKKGITPIRLDARKTNFKKAVVDGVKIACQEKIERDRRKGILNRPIRAMVVGIPNVGKSTFLSRVTHAKPKIANYHFTTIEPNLGVVKTASGDSFVIADIPGIIEGASEGVGLGIQFLRHVERTRLLLHVIDVSGSEGRDPVEDYHTINEELKKYSEKLATRKQILVANKIDVMQDDERLKELEELAKKEKLELFKISGVTGEGVSELLNRVSEVLKTLPKEEIVEEEDKVIYTLDDDKEEFTVRKDGDTFVVEGKAVNRLMGRINIDDNESMYYFQKKLKELGIEDELKRQGICEGDYVKMLNWTFEWYQ